LCPDFALLVVIAIALQWQRAAGGLLLAFALGYAADLVSGSLMGQHALLRLLVFAGVRATSRQLNFSGGLPLAAFAGAVILMYGVVLLAVTGFFAGSAELRLSWLGDQLLHAVMGALFAPITTACVGRVSIWLTEDEGARRTLELTPRGRAA
jgi:rod shape-determining protein MreD